jgi:hypothetical protein
MTSMNLKTGKLANSNLNKVKRYQKPPKQQKGGNKRNRQRRRKQSIIGLGMVSYNMTHLIKGHTLKYAEACVNPFDDICLGCKRPDGSPYTVSAIDRMQLTLPITSLATYMGPNFGGVLIAFVPRCTVVGWLTGNQTATSPAVVISPEIQFTQYDSNFSPITSTQILVPSDAYYILLAGLGINGSFYRIDAAGTGVEIGYMCIRTTRQTALQETSASLRILGAGCKLWPNSPPISTGGKVFSGMMSQNDMFSSFRGTSGYANAQTLESQIQSKLAFYGLDGTTVRYNTFSDKEQIDFHDTNLEELYSDLLPSGEINIVQEGNRQYSSQDLIGPGSGIPIMVWRYQSASDVFDLTFNMIAHLEVKPRGTSPYEQSFLLYDPKLTHLDKVLGSTHFPLSVKGHSFKTFVSKAKTFIHRTLRSADDISKIIQLVEKVLGGV